MGIMGYFVDDIAERLALHQERDGWQVGYFIISRCHVQTSKKKKNSLSISKLTVHLISHRKSKPLHHVDSKKLSRWKTSLISIGSSPLLSLEGSHQRVVRGLSRRTALFFLNILIFKNRSVFLSRVM